MFEEYNPSERAAAQQENIELQNHIKKGAGWFYWIAGASVVNTLIFLFGGNINFIVGLGITQLINGFGVAIEREIGATTTLKVGVFLINLAISAMFLVIGYFAGKGLAWMFIVGIVLYVLDGLIFLLFGDILSLGFHAFALFFIIKGFMAANNLRKIQPTFDAQ